MIPHTTTTITNNNNSHHLKFTHESRFRTTSWQLSASPVD